jgi:hypothetical protein
MPRKNLSDTQKSSSDVVGNIVMRFPKIKDVPKALSEEEMAAKKEYRLRSQLKEQNKKADTRKKNIKTQTVLIHKQVNTNMNADEAREFVKFFSGAAPIKSAADTSAVVITFDKFIWHISDNNECTMPQPEMLGKADMVVVNCKTIEEAGFLCIAKWNQIYPDKKFEVPDSLTKVAEEFMPTLKSVKSTILTKSHSVLKSFWGLKSNNLGRKKRSPSDDASASYTPDDNHSPKTTPRRLQS